MLGYINKVEGTIEPVSFQFGHVDAWLNPALGKPLSNNDHFVVTFPFGVSDPYDKTKVGIAKRLNLQCSFKSAKATGDLRAIEENHINQNVKNGRKWFPKMFEMNPKDVDKLYKDANSDEDKAAKALIASIKDEDDQKAARKKFEKTLIERNAEEQIRGNFKSNIQESDKYDNTWRAKINVESGPDGPATEIMLLSLQNGKPVMSLGSSKNITKFSKGILIVEQSPGQWYQPKEFGCSYSVSKILLIPAASKKVGDFNMGDFDIGMATEPVDRSQFEGQDPADAPEEPEVAASSAATKKRSREEVAPTQDSDSNAKKIRTEHSDQEESGEEEEDEETPSNLE